MSYAPVMKNKIDDKIKILNDVYDAQIEVFKMCLDKNLFVTIKDEKSEDISFETIYKIQLIMTLKNIDKSIMELVKKLSSNELKEHLPQVSKH